MDELDRGDGTGSSAASVLIVLEGMAGAGVDIDALCSATGLSRQDLETREALVPTAQVSAVWREGTRLYGRGTLGLAVAQAAPAGRSVVDYVASSSATLRQA